MSLKSKLKKIHGLRTFVRCAKFAVGDLKAISGLRAQKKLRKKQGPIRVGFVCQFIPVWHKLEALYKLMQADVRFDPIMVCVPSAIKDDRPDTEGGINDTLVYFRENGYPEAMDAMQEDGSWLDLETLDLDFVFFPRPYNHHMPSAYHSSKVSRYCRICMVLYGMNISVEDADTTLNRDFFRHVSCFFAENTFSLKSNRQQGWLLHLLGLQHSVYYGMPGIESFREAEQLPRPAWDFSKNNFRVMWTPRWTTDPELGGSNFFTYYRFLTEYAKTHTDMDFLFRPHPLTIPHFLETGELTQDDADDWLATCQALPNVSMDTEKGYAATFWGTDVLVTDTSGVIPEYLVTGHPMIFCASNMYLTPVPNTKRMLEGCYIVNNQEELSRCLADLQAGIDPLADARKKMVEELFGAQRGNPAQKMLEHLADCR